VGVTGELYIGGAGVARGYLHNPVLTAERFIPDPFSGERMYKTGDLVFMLPDGNLVFAGRIDRQVKIRGHRVELEEVEAVLGWHPTVVHAAVIVEGESGSEKLRAFVVYGEERAPGRDELRLHMSRHLPDHMIPYTFTALQEMPRSTSGKIDRQALMKLPPEGADLVHAVSMPRTEMERRIRELWVEVMEMKELDAAQIGVHENFYELGGDSLQATRLITALEREFGRELTFGELARVPTIEGMAQALEQESSGAGEDFVVVHRAQGVLPPLICVSSAANDPWIFRHLARYVSEEQPMSALPNPIRPGETFDDARAIGARVRESIAKLRPHGPYVLAGYCLGGVAAFEAAQLLIASGETVALVAPFDTPAPGYPKVWSSWRRYLREFGAWVSSPQSIGFRKVAEHAQKASQLIGQTAKARYAPQPLNAPIAVFMAEDDPVSSRVLEDPRLGWRDLTTRSLHVERVQGSHTTVLAETYAAGIADKLSRLIETVKCTRCAK
jgi:thioesterase domain-containing protein/acyl carrier protein